MVETISLEMLSGKLPEQGWAVGKGMSDLQSSPAMKEIGDLAGQSWKWSNHAHRIYGNARVQRDHSKATDLQ